jgi:hypothetical protein
MTMNSDTVSVLEGNTFVVGRRNGDFDAGPAWATGAPLLLLRVVLGLEPHAGAIEQHAVLPERIRELALHDLPGPTGSYDASAALAKAGRG